MRFAFHPGARVEYLQAVTHYEERQTGLGTRFAMEIEGTIQRIIEAPDRWRKLEGEVRRCLTHTFPYGVLYAVEEDHVLILAVMHHSRKPDYWHDRAG